jgi:hypothetical protein
LNLLMVIAINIGCIASDGYTTVWMYGHDSIVVYKGYEWVRPPEKGLAKHFIGEYPTWSSMLPWGATEVIGLSCLSYCLKRWDSRYWWVPQIGVSAIHLACAGRNLQARMNDKKAMDEYIKANTVAWRIMIKISP